MSARPKSKIFRISAPPQKLTISVEVDEMSIIDNDSDVDNYIGNEK